MTGSAIGTAHDSRFTSPIRIEKTKRTARMFPGVIQIVLNQHDITGIMCRIDLVECQKTFEQHSIKPRRRWIDLNISIRNVAQKMGEGSIGHCLRFIQIRLLTSNLIEQSAGMDYSPGIVGIRAKVDHTIICDVIPIHARRRLQRLEPL